MEKHIALPAIVRTQDQVALAVRGLRVSYGDRQILDDVSFEVASGELVGIIGPNGAGKTTLLKALLQLVPASGSVLLKGHPIRRRSRSVAYVPQITAVNWRFPATVLDVVVMGRTGVLGWLRWPGSHDRKLAQAALEEVGMAELAGRSIGELSGGQQQRVFLARALAQQPDVLLLDEPISGVDVPTQEVILHLLRDLSMAGKTIMLTTHHLQHLEHHFDSLLCLNQRLVAYGPPERVLTPAVVEATFGRSLVVGSHGEQIILECGHDM